MTNPVDVLRKAAMAIEEGTEKHGDTRRSFDMIGKLWTTYISHAMTTKTTRELNGFDVANMMTMVKLARAVYGVSVDNQVDTAGYAALAAMLNPTRPLEDEMADELNKELGNGNDAKSI